MKDDKGKKIKEIEIDIKKIKAKLKNKKKELQIEKKGRDLYVRLSSLANKKLIGVTLLILGVIIFSIGFININIPMTFVGFFLAFYGLYLHPLEINGSKYDGLSDESFVTALYEMEHNELIEFIKHVFTKDKKDSIIRYRKTFKRLEKLDDVTIEYGIARMKLIEEEYNIKSIPYLLTIIVVMLPYYKTVLDFIGKNEAEKIALTANLAVDISTSWTMFWFTLFLLIFISYFITTLKKKMRIAVYFRSLLESAREIKKEKK